jgi:hypothetical protein
MVISQSLDQLLTCGDNSLKVHDMTDIKIIHEIVNFGDDFRPLKLSLSDDAQFLTISDKA